MKALAMISSVLIWYIVCYAYMYTITAPLFQILA